MSSIVALGDRALLEVAVRVQTDAVETIWVHGADIGNDIRCTRLESLLDPLMDAYFAHETNWRVDACARAIRAEPQFDLIVGPTEIADAADRVLKRELRSCLALVEMLDRANVRHPVDLVLVGADDQALPRTAVAWAKANGVRSVLLADAPSLAGASEPATDHVVTYGERGRAAYVAIGVREPRVTIVPSPRYAFRLALNANAEQYRRALETNCGFGRDDFLIAFEPNTQSFDPAGTNGTSFEGSLREMFAAFATVRSNLRSARLIIIPSVAVEGGAALVAQITGLLGIENGAVVYVEADPDPLLTVVNVFVGGASLRAFEVALGGTPSINVWNPDQWYRGPALGADDGVIDAVPQTLASTLLALAQNPSIAGQIAAIVRERAADFGFVPADGAAVRVGQEVARYRRSSARAIVVRHKPDILIYAPAYVHASAGVRALYRLCHFINMLSGDATIFPAKDVHPTWSTPARTIPVTERTIVVYPETAVKELRAVRNVRWVLNVPGLLAGPAKYDDDDMVFYHTGFLDAAQRATSERLTPERELAVGTVEPELFYLDESRPKLYDCIYIGKGRARYDQFRLPELDRALVIRGGADPWPATRLEMAALLRGCRNLYMYDEQSAILEEARLCGARPYIVTKTGRIEWFPSGTPLEFAELNVTAYFDSSHVERFLRQIEERWS